MNCWCASSPRKGGARAARRADHATANFTPSAAKARAGRKQAASSGASCRANRSRRSPSAISRRRASRRRTSRSSRTSCSAAGCGSMASKSWRSCASPDGTWVVLDLYHSFMAMPCDFRRVADRVFLLGGGYKYAMTGEGAGFMHAPPGYADAPAEHRLVRGLRRDGSQARRGRLFRRRRALPRRDVRSDRALSLQRRARDAGRAKAWTRRRSRARCDALRAHDGGGDRSRRSGRACARPNCCEPNANGPNARFIALRHPEGGAVESDADGREHHHRRARRCAADRVWAVSGRRRCRRVLRGRRRCWRRSLGS